MKISKIRRRGFHYLFLLWPLASTHPYNSWPSEGRVISDADHVKYGDKKSLYYFGLISE